MIAWSAFSMMNLYRGSASLPSSSWNASCASRGFSISTLSSVRVRGSSVVSAKHFGLHFAEALEPRDLGLRVRPQAGEDLFLVGVVLGPVRLLADVDAVQRRLGDVDVPLADQLRHVAEEEVEQQRA